MVSHYRATRLGPSATQIEGNFYNIAILGSAINATGQIVGYHGPELRYGLPGDTVGPYTPFIYSIELTDLCSPGCKAGSGQAINGTGQVTGQADGHAFLYSDGKMLDLGTLGGSDSTGNGINDSGQVVGISTTGDYSGFAPTTHAFLYSDGVMVDMGALGGSSSGANGINNKGETTGWWSNTPGDGQYGPRRAFLYTGGKMIDLDLPPNKDSAGNAINDNEEITGCFVPNSELGGWCHAFLYSGGHMIDLNDQFLSGAGSGLGTGINNKGQVVGWASSTTPPDTYAFLFSEGKLYDLNALVIDGLDGHYLSRAVAINDSGQIVAVGYASGYGLGGTVATWRLDPTP
ncbi:MAG: hypothetical protein ACM3IH_09450 [Sphingobacteriales bacterium]